MYKQLINNLRTTVFIKLMCSYISYLFLPVSIRLFIYLSFLILTTCFLSSYVSIESECSIDSILDNQPIIIDSTLIRPEHIHEPLVSRYNNNFADIQPVVRVLPELVERLNQEYNFVQTQTMEFRVVHLTAEIDYEHARFRELMNKSNYEELQSISANSDEARSEHMQKSIQAIDEAFNSVRTTIQCEEYLDIAQNKLDKLRRNS